jgi:hypothetical protein
MTRKLNRNYSLSVVVPFIGILILLIAAAVLAQTSGAGQTSGKEAAVLATAGTTVSAQAERPLMPWTHDAGSFPVGRSHTKRHGARPMDGGSLFGPVTLYDLGGADPSAQFTSVAVADVNDDGKPDVVVTNGDGTLSVLLGNGDGSFQPPVTYNPGLQEPTGVAVADLNGDGKQDLAVPNGYSKVSVLLGNGDGTFQAPVSYGTGGNGPSSVAITDVNGDGHPDIVMANWGTNTVSVLLGNGDGTFQPAVTYSSGGGGPTGVAIADVNGDGKPDIVVANYVSASVGVLLGNGDGTFQAPVSYGTGGSWVNAVAIGDVNGDGKPDLAVATSCGGACDGTVAVLLGNGDGTFQPAVLYDTGVYLAPAAVAIADVNGDGIPDLVAADFYGVPTGNISVLQGNGDGTFQSPLIYGSGGIWPDSIIASDVNGDGNTDLVVGNSNWDIGNSSVGVLLNASELRATTTTTLASSLNPSGYGQAVTFTAAVSAASGTPTGTVIFYDGSNAIGRATLAGGTASFSYSSLTAGSHSITAAYQGSPGFRPSTSAPLIQVVNGLTTTTTLVSSLNPSVYGQAVTFTAAVNSASGTPTGTVIFYDGSTAIGSVTLANGSASLSTSSLAAGSHSMTAAYQGSSSFAPSTSAPLNQVVNPATTTTSLVSSANPARVRQSVTYTATVTSQYGGAATGTVTFQDGGSTIATVSLANNQAAYSTKYKKGGSHAITATYSGDANNLGSTSTTLMEYIESAVTKTVVTTSGSPSFVGQPVTFTATVTSTYGTIPDGELVTFYNEKTEIGTGTTASGVATFTTSSLKVGKHTIKANYAGDDTFEPSTGSVKQVVEK